MAAPSKGKEVAPRQKEGKGQDISEEALRRAKELVREGDPHAALNILRGARDQISQGGDKPPAELTGRIDALAEDVRSFDCA